jgi:hypothetical protein
MAKMFMLFSAYSIHAHRHAPHLSPSVESSPVVGNAFTHAGEDWRDGTYEHFKDWAARQFGIEDLESDNEAEVPVHEMKAKNVLFERNEDGDLIAFNVELQKCMSETKWHSSIHRSCLSLVDPAHLLEFF